MHRDAQCRKGVQESFLNKVMLKNCPLFEGGSEPIEQVLGSCFTRLRVFVYIGSNYKVNLLLRCWTVIKQ